MKNLFVLLAVLLCGLASCQKNTSEPEEPEVVEVKAERIELNVPFNYSKPYPFDVSYLIQSQEALDSLAKNPPQIDFTRYTLLGFQFYIDSKCPFPPIYIQILKNTRTRTYQYLLEYDYRGVCASPWGDTFWYLIPKMEPNATVKFERIEIINKYKYDSVEIEKNLKFWLSNTEYGVAKTIFKNGEPIYVNYSFKNYTGKPLEWCQTADYRLCEISINGASATYYYPEDRRSNDTTINGILKTGETVQTSWKIRELPPGEWRALGLPLRDFKFILLDDKKLNFTVEE